MMEVDRVTESKPPHLCLGARQLQAVHVHGCWASRNKSQKTSSSELTVFSVHDLSKKRVGAWPCNQMHGKAHCQITNDHFREYVPHLARSMRLNFGFTYN